MVVGHIQPVAPRVECHGWNLILLPVRLTCRRPAAEVLIYGLEMLVPPNMLGYL